MTVTSIFTLKEKIFERRGVTENQDEDTTRLPTGPSVPWARCHVDLSCSTWSLSFSQGQESQWGKESLKQCHEIIIIFFFFWPHYTAFGILVLWPGMEPVPKLGVLTMRSSFHMLSMPGLKTVACSMGKIKDIASPPWWPLSTLCFPSGQRGQPQATPWTAVELFYLN